MSLYLEVPIYPSMSHMLIITKKFKEYISINNEKRIFFSQLRAFNGYLLLIEVQNQ